MARGIPTPEQYRAMFRPMHAMIDSVGEPVTIRVRNAAGTYDDHGPIMAKMSAFRADEIIPGGPAKLGDVRAIVRAGALPPGLRRLENKDRVSWKGRDYAVTNWDDSSHAVGGETMAVEIWIRG